MAACSKKTSSFEDGTIPLREAFADQPDDDLDLPAVVRRKAPARPVQKRAAKPQRKPSPAERDECNRIIMDELVCSRFTPAGVAYFQQVIARMKDQGCDAVVLGCTEIPLLISDGNSPLPTLDSTRLLARAALKRAVQDAALAA